MFESLTVMSSGHNIKPFAVAALESLCYFYPELRNKIYYFDDNSTDGTSEELLSRGFKIMKWQYEEKNYYDMLEMFKNYIYNNSLNKDEYLIHILASKVSLMMREMVKQCKTKYLLIFDGDVIFFKKGFLEEISELIKQYPVVSHIEISPVFHDENLLNEFREKHPQYAKNLVEENDKIGLPRIHYMFTVLDVEYLKNIDVLGDECTNEMYLINNGVFLDAGSSFYKGLTDKKVPIRNFNIYEYMHHFSWISSSRFDKYKNISNSRRDFIKELGVDFRSKYPDAYNMLKTINMNTRDLITHFINGYGKEECLE